MKLQLLGQPLLADSVATSSLSYVADALRRLRKDLKTAAKATDYDPEVTHAMRVSTRKAEVALRLLKQAGVRVGGGKLVRRLKKLRRACGPLRDADARWEHVLRLRTGTEPQDWTLLAGAVIHAHAEAWRNFEEALPKLCRLRRSFRRGEQTVKKALADLDVRNPRRLKRWLTKEVEPWSHGLDERIATERDLHQLRIDVKKLRYLLAALAGEHEAAFESTTARLRQLQERLGAVHDCQVFGQWLDQLGDSLCRDTDHAMEAWRGAIATWRSRLAGEIEGHLQAFEQMKLQTPDWRRLRLA